MPATQIELTRVTRRYDAIAVLDGLDLRVAEGEFLVLLGRSGSGKSTLLNLIAGIDVPDSGSVRVAAQEISRLGDGARTRFRRRAVGLVFQQFNLVPTLTVTENLLLPLQLAGIAATGQVEAMLERLGLNGKGGRYPEALSGGEQQRVAIGRALIHDPPVVLADEPTGALDLETGREVLALLDDLVRARGRTLVMATHAREVIGYADRVVTIRGGRIEDREVDAGA